jgi:glycerol-3-phosphate acyltransferase PlsY
MTENPFRFGQRPAGFRILVSDIFVTLFAIATAGGIWYWAQGDKIIQTFALMPLVILVHFFLFCNIFRISRKLELIWGIIFVVVVFANMEFDRRSPNPLKFWLNTVLVLSPVTVANMVWAIFTKDYHGIGYRLLPWGRIIKIYEDELPK